MSTPAEMFSQKYPEFKANLARDLFENEAAEILAKIIDSPGEVSYLLGIAVKHRMFLVDDAKAVVSEDPCEESEHLLQHAEERQSKAEELLEEWRELVRVMQGPFAIRDHAYHLRGPALKA